MAGINQQAETQKAEAAKKQREIHAAAAAATAEIDPLDAYMAGLAASSSSSSSSSTTSSSSSSSSRTRGQRMDDEDDGFDEMQAQLSALRESGGRLSADATTKEMQRAEREAERAGASAAASTKGGRGPIEYDDDGNPIAPTETKEVPTLQPLDHSALRHAPFQKNFYAEHADVSKMSDADVAAFRGRNTIKISGGVGGAGLLRPITSFAHAGFDKLLTARIAAVGYTVPTPIQCQVLPVILSGHDVIGIAKTGSGKTLAFVWPIIVHCMAQRELKVRA